MPNLTQKRWPAASTTSTPRVLVRVLVRVLAMFAFLHCSMMSSSFGRVGL